MKKHILWKRIFLALTVLVTAFIFGQSIMNRATSNHESGQIASGFLYWLRGMGFEIEPALLNAIVRKMAHFVEFTALGVCAGGYAYHLGALHGRIYLALPAWLTLLIAVCDEFIQTFSDRAGMVSDVILDYSGAVFGMLIVAGFVCVKNKIARRKNHEN